MSTKSLVRRYLEDGSITGSQVKMFHKAVRHLYMKAFHYSTTHLPLSNELLKNATLLNFKLRTQCTFSQVEYLVQSTHVPCIVAIVLTALLDRLGMENGTERTFV